MTDRILDAGRLAGSAGNRQRRRFVVVESEDARQRLAEAVFEPGNVRNAGLVVAVVVPDGRMPLDAGRAAQNMLLAAWNDGIDATPNGSRTPTRRARSSGSPKTRRLRSCSRSADRRACVSLSGACRGLERAREP